MQIFGEWICKRLETPLNAYMESISTSPSRRAYSLAEAADLCGVSYHTIYRAVCRGHLKRLSGFGRLMVSDQELNRFLSRAEQYQPVGKRGE
jgi:hypothetical protein